MKKTTNLLCVFLCIFWLKNLFAETTYLLPSISTDTNDTSNTTQSTITQNANLQIHIDQKTIISSGAKTVSEAIEQLANVQRYSQTSSNPIFYIHGLRAQVLLNGEPLSGFDSSASMINLIPIDSIDYIDVSTNGDSTNYNDGMLGGIINIVTKIKKTQISITATYPKYGQLSASILKKIDQNNRLGILQSVNNNYGYRNHDNDQTSQSMLEYTHSYDHGHVDTNLIYLTQNSQFPGGLTQQQYNQNPYQASSGWEIYKQRNLNIQSNWQQDLGETEILQTQFQYRQLNAQGYFPEWNSSFEQNYQTISLSPNLRLLYTSDDLDKTLSVKTGINYRYESFVNTSSINNAYRQSISNSNQIKEIINQWRFIQAFRYGITYDHGSFINYNNSPASVDPPKNKTYYPFSANLALSYRFNQNLESSIGFSHNYQLPFIDQSNLTNNIESGFGLKPQTSNGLAFSQRYKNAKLIPIQISGDLYTLWIDNQIAYDPNQPSGNPFPGANVNLAPIFQYGSDLIANLEITQTFLVGLSINVNIAKFQSGQLADGTSIEGNTVPGSPTSSFEAHSQLSFLHNYQWYLQAQYHGSSYADGDFSNTEGKIAAYWLINTAINYQNLPWIVTLRINNLLNERYNQYITDVNHQWNYYPGDGINGSLTLTYQFT
ncbi:TonB-dependent receptor plug domain-containing protein [Thiotrichales bacterium 19S3-7]|nr:TonB-dependent receptor plug domain-containing protein [Thiotrichales bacterium 19S3-7]MCF6800905.1 TonB-dependent receptor plug domain-containing protein [Thiotrichales bacterium 19S3-11]